MAHAVGPISAAAAAPVAPQTTNEKTTGSISSDSGQVKPVESKKSNCFQDAWAWLSSKITAIWESIKGCFESLTSCCRSSKKEEDGAVATQKNQQKPAADEAPIKPETTGS